MAAEIDEIAKRRYLELCKQQAAYGVSTPPEIMLEIADLRQKYGPVEMLDQPVYHRPPERRRKLDLDVAFLIAQVGSLTHRQLQTERALSSFTSAMRIIGVLSSVALLIGLIGLVAYVAR